MPPLMRVKKCDGCEEPYISRSNRGRFCSNPCLQIFHRCDGYVPRRSGRLCEGCGDALPIEANLGTKYCGNDCRPATRPNGRTTTLPKKLRIRMDTCAYCSKSFQTANTLQIYCSEWCSDMAQHCKRKKTTAYEYRLGRTCPYCGEGVSDGDRVNKKYCSVSCQMKTNAAIRRARRRNLPAEDVSRIEIFERDAYICHICILPIEDGPVLDHLIPLAFDYSPGHVKSNVAAAHAFCNFSKCARVRPEDFRLHQELLDFYNAEEVMPI